MITELVCFVEIEKKTSQNAIGLRASTFSNDVKYLVEFTESKS